jgi:hypothetical protein
LAVPLGVESISMRSLTAPWRIETPGGAGRALEADFSISRSVEDEMVGADAFVRVLVSILEAGIHNGIWK